MKGKRMLIGLVLACLLVGGQAAAATYEVRVTNLTKQLTFTPLLVVSHKPGVSLFELGEAASLELEIVAETGGTGPLEALLGTLPSQVLATGSNGEFVGPGETTTIEISAGGAFRRISLAGMLIPTNDTFVALDSARIPSGHSVERRAAIAYDAGTEENDQNCANMPGPGCPGGGNGALSPPADGDEGYVYVGNGFHDLGNMDGEGNVILGPLGYDWRNPVAMIEIQRKSDDNDEHDDESNDEDEDD